MKTDDIIRMIEELKVGMAKTATKMFTPNMTGYRPMQITFMPQTKYKFGRANWYVADFDTQYYGEVEEWCKEQFGPHPRFPDAWSRWVHTYEDQTHFLESRRLHYV